MKWLRKLRIDRGKLYRITIYSGYAGGKLVIVVPNVEPFIDRKHVKNMPVTGFKLINRTTMVHRVR